MAPTSKDDLRKLKRVELQALAKENNIKANLKTEALVEALTAALGFRVAARSSPSEGASADRTPGQQATDEEQKHMVAKVDNLVLLVADLQSELRETRQAIAVMRDEMKQHTSAGAPCTSADVKVLIQAALDAQRQNRDEEMQALRKDITAQVQVLQQEGAQATEISARVLERLSRLEDTAAEPAARSDKLEAMWPRIDALESRLDLLACKTSRVDAADNSMNASPAGLDAPPTQTLISFSSPAVAPLRSAAIATDLRHPGSKPVVQTGTPGPRALPSHMVAAATLAARRTPRAALGATQPESPVPLLNNFSLGKHGRSSDASNLSNTAGADATPARSEAGFHTAPSSIAQVAPTSVSSHARKRARVNASAGGCGPLGSEDSSDDDVEAREYTVRTKTGSSPAVAKSSHRASVTQDPSFFALRPVSPCARPARSRASSRASDADENGSGPTTSRKSLPLSELPFPLVSPYRGATRFNSAAPTPDGKGKMQRAGSLFAGPAQTTTTDGTTSSKHGFGAFFSGLDSVNRVDASRRPSFFAPVNASAKKGSVLPPPPTPPASRTLFGTEFAENRFGDAAGAEAEEEEQGGEDSARLRWGAFTA
ncbi:hypothetical protein JCM3774_006796 [Rhodotorula dairenensis]